MANTERRLALCPFYGFVPQDILNVLNIFLHKTAK
jgi:hypothetical protein